MAISLSRLHFRVTALRLFIRLIFALPPKPLEVLTLYLGYNILLHS